MADKKISQLPQGSIINDTDEMVMVQANSTKRFNASLLKTFIGSIAKGNLTESTSSVLTIGNGTNAVIGTGTTIQVKQASALQDGFISSSDYTSFSSKEPALTKGSLTESTSGVLTITGGTSSVIGTGTSIEVKQASASQNGYLSSANWSTFNGKQDSITGGATTITSSNLTALRAVASDASGKVAVSATTSTELGYVSGVTSAIQTQLNAKQGSLTLTTTGTSGAATLVGSTLNIPQYSGGGSYTFSTGLTNTSGTVTNNLSTGVSGGQSVIGGTAASNSLTLSSTSNATKGKILFGTSAYDEVNNRLGIGTASPSNFLDIQFNNSSASGAGITMKNANSAGRTDIAMTNDGVGGGGFLVYGSTFGAPYSNNFGSYSLKSYIIGSDASVVNGGTSTIQFTTGGYGNNATLTVTGGNTGNVLIGTSTNAGYKLDVNGTARVSGDVTSTGAFKSVIGGNTTAQFTAYSPSSPYPRGQFLIGYNSSDANIGLTIAPLFSSTGVQKPAFIQVSTNSNTTDSGQYGGTLICSTTTFNISSAKADGTVSGGVPITFSPANTEALRLQTNGNVGLGTSTDNGYKLDVNGTVRSTQFYLSALNTAPATAASTGTLGEIRIDASYIYVCTATNTWKRSQIATW